MKRGGRQILLLLLLSLLVLSYDRICLNTPLATATNQITWAEDIELMTNFTVPSDSILNVHPGVNISFADGAYLIIKGGINAVGLPTQPITFTSSNSTPKRGCWGGIVIENDRSISKLDYVNIEYADMAINCKDTNLDLRNSTISNNNYGVVMSRTVGIIQNVTFRNNFIQGISLTSSTPLIISSTIENSIHGIACYFESNAIIRNCTVSNSNIHSIDSNPILENNFFLNGSDFRKLWYLTVEIKDKEGRYIDTANVVAIDSLGKETQSFNHSDGKYFFLLPELIEHENHTKTVFTPYRIIARAEGISESVCIDLPPRGIVSITLDIASSSLWDRYRLCFVPTSIIVILIIFIAIWQKKYRPSKLSDSDRFVSEEVTQIEDKPLLPKSQTRESEETFEENSPADTSGPWP